MLDVKFASHLLVFEGDIKYCNIKNAQSISKQMNLDFTPFDSKETRFQCEVNDERTKVCRLIDVDFDKKHLN